ncbi:TRAP transporter substrate-binding protein [Photobacterium sp. GJ3]|uniref:TRAP transporter substrate-binding protein n=1 Tax=Photobacterium sp. GJ3 TaxID=2829502 RepID=UPI001B8C701E|nr:TRAP transporter substrate-binding protein [Photobacterium sp. GJ3]QUJ66845.1 TRAP transporter substrate-binding protein [Photobacterium sp. GJ3]
MTFKQFKNKSFAISVISAALMTSFSVSSTTMVRMSIDGNPNANPDLPAVRSIQYLKDELEKTGDFRVKVFWDNRLAKSPQSQINGIQNNLFQLTGIALPAVSEFSPAYIPLSNLFLFKYPDVESPRKFIDGKGGQMMSKRMNDETGLRAELYMEVGYRHLTSIDKPIEELSDIKNRKIRVQPNPIHIEAFKELGASPTPISWAELFTSLQQKVIDGAENPFDNIVQARLYEPQKYLTLSGHAYDFVGYFTNEAFYQGLTDKEKSSWDQAFDKTQLYFRGIVDQSWAQQLEFLKDGKMAVTYLSDQELDKFKKAVSKSWDLSEKIMAERYPDGAEYYSTIMSEIKSANTSQ